MVDIDKNYIVFSRNAPDLCAFMIVCRHGQLSSAAREMRISQPSLSQRIKNLEMALGHRLFDRTSKGVELTREGLSLFNSMEKPLGLVADRFRDFVERDRSSQVMISVDYAFASFWLLPRIPLIRDALGNANICVLTSQNPVEDAGSDADMTIHMVNAHQARASETLVLAEQVSAICSPQFKQEHPDIQQPGDLLRLTARLLHLTAPSQEDRWCDWKEWLGRFSLATHSLSKDTVFSNYEMIIRAAIDGQGVALGWHGLIENLFTGRDLTMLLPETVTTKRGYYIGLHQSRTSRIARDLHDWILEEARKPQTTGLL